MIINSCSGCGNCLEFIDAGTCPTRAFLFERGKGYGGAKIVTNLCIDCKKCKEIDCMGEAIKEKA